MNSSTDFPEPIGWVGGLRSRTLATPDIAVNRRVGGLSMAAGQYGDLESALSGPETFGDAIFDISNRGAWHGLAERRLVSLTSDAGRLSTVAYRGSSRDSS